MQSVQSQPVMPPALGVLAEFAVPKPTTLIIKEKAFNLTGDDFAITDSNGIVVCRVEGKAMSWSERKEFIDGAGRPLFTLKKKHMSWRMGFEGFTPAGDLLFEVGGKVELIGSRTVASFKNVSDGKPVEIEVTGNWRHKKAEMVVLGTGQVFASLSCHMANAREIFAGQQTYHVEVQPHVDLALIAALTVVFDERCNEPKPAAGF